MKIANMPKKATHDCAVPGAGEDPFGSRFYDHVLRTRGEFDEALEYIHMNPVVKGLVQDSFAWPWSSARWFVERQGPVEIDQIRLPCGPKSRI